jgi:signal transduction histidine kinase
MTANELVILIRMANPADAGVVSRLLTQAGLAFKLCPDIEAMAAEVGQDSGPLLLEEEALSPPALAGLNAVLDRQPPWSDLPVVLLVRKPKSFNGKGKEWPRLIRNLTLVERPVSSASLVSILQTALQARRRQYEVRDLLVNLRNLNENLEQRVAARTGELERRAAEMERLTAELKRSNEELEQFAYVASHDLQTPLRSVTGFLDLLSRRYKSRLGPEADEFITFAVEGAERMHQLINDILVFSRVATRGQPFAPVDTRAVLAQTLAGLGAAIRESGAEITQGELPTVHGDESQLVQLFQNLIGNARKYRNESEPPRIRVDAGEHETGWEFRIEDNGIGFEPRHAERIFEIFQRLHTIGEYPGTGIGLAICKKIVERHGGRIWVESEPGKGSTFFFTLPKA